MPSSRGGCGAARLVAVAALSIGVAACGDVKTIALFKDAGGGGVKTDAGGGAGGGDAAPGDDAPTRCERDEECGGALPYCDDREDRCAECLSREHCAEGQSCAFESHTCVVSCRSSADCAGGGRPICALASGLCVECGGDGDCPDWEPLCDVRSGRCADCLDDDDCGRGESCERGECRG